MHLVVGAPSTLKQVFYRLPHLLWSEAIWIQGAVPQQITAKRPESRSEIFQLGRTILGDLPPAIAFQKTAKGTCLMTESPGAVDAKQLRELYLELKAAKKQPPAEAKS